jgi:hypothetical protein
MKDFVKTPGLLSCRWFTCMWWRLPTFIEENERSFNAALNTYSNYAIEEAEEDDDIQQEHRASRVERKQSLQRILQIKDEKALAEGPTCLIGTTDRQMGLEKQKQTSRTVV